MAKAKPEGSTPAPQITFDEKEIQGVADFVNYVYNNAVFTQKPVEAMKLTKLLNHMHHHIKKMEDHVFDPSTFVVTESKK
jgi:hypothetical protein